MDEEHLDSLKEEYRRHTLRKIFFIVACVLFMVAALAVSVTIGGYQISVAEVYETIWDHLTGATPDLYSRDWYNDQIVWNERLPRVLFAIVAGAGLTVSGVVMQSIMKNPLAEPYTTGVSAGAYFGVSLSIVLGVSLSVAGTAIEALIFALLPVAVMFVLSSRFVNSVATVILIGTALTYMFNSFSTLILVSTDADTLANVYKWQVGSFANITWDELYIVAAAVILCIAVIMILARRLNVMSMGDENASSLGLNVKRLRILCLVVMAIMVAFIVTYSGIIGFVGLICPHIVRLVIGSDNRFVVPASAAFGAAFLLTADTIAKWLSSLDTVPVGVVTSLIGAPIFLAILIRNRRSVW